ncbi:MAG: tyrosine-protein phosphatase [Sphingomonadaceae bacterium]|nr:tyrosine-protein phosphatase [Sphingomonadaceae bacterium]
MTFACAPNFRDAGDKPTVDGRHVLGRRIYRAEAICTPTVDEATMLAGLGIRLVCDLRSARERETAVSHWLGTGPTVLPMDVVADFRAGIDPLAAMRTDPGEQGAVRLMIDTYEALPAACAPHLAKLFQQVAGGDTPVLIHCTAGKDRTGFVVAMLLHALGVADDAIMADYMRSDDCANPVVVAATRAMMATALGQSVDEAALAALAGVRLAYLEASYSRIAQDHGSINAYLREAAGLDSVRRDAIVAALVE